MSDETNKARGFLYFLPGAHGAALTLESEAIKASGLASVLRTVGACGPLQDGPGGGAGVIFAGAKGVAVKYAPKKQTWLQGPDYWVGYWNDAKPGPVDLMRDNIIPGYMATLEDGQEWTVPLARIHTGGTLFPERAGIDAAGKVVFTPMERYREISQHALDVFETIVALTTGGTQNVDKGELFKIAVMALSVNYHVGAPELTMMGVLSTYNLSTVCGYLADLPGYMRLKRQERITGGDDDEALEEKNGPTPILAG